MGRTSFPPPRRVAPRARVNEAVPRLSRVAALWNAANPANERPWREAQDAARALGLILQSQEVRRLSDRLPLQPRAHVLEGVRINNEGPGLQRGLARPVRRARVGRAGYMQCTASRLRGCSCAGRPDGSARRRTDRAR